MSSNTYLDFDIYNSHLLTEFLLISSLNNNIYIPHIIQENF